MGCEGVWRLAGVIGDFGQDPAVCYPLLGVGEAVVIARYSREEKHKPTRRREFANI